MMDSENISEVEYDELVKKYFREDKTAWYEDRESGKYWDHSAKVSIFWKMIRKHFMPRSIKAKEFICTHYIFPEFQFGASISGIAKMESNFWERDSKAIFEYPVTFQQCIFQGRTDLNNINFKGGVSFRYSKFRDNLSIRNSFLHSADFRDVVHQKVEIEASQFAQSFDFTSTVFSDQFVFRRVNLRKVLFWQCDLSNARFKECDWGDDFRIRLYDEKTRIKTLDDLKGMEELYRQLKRKFDADKDWERSGRAYISEVEMRKTRLWKQKNYYQWFIYWFYGFFGGYTQNLQKPILSIIGLVMVFSCIYFFIDYNPLYALQRGIKGALPYLSIDIAKDDQFNGYWLIARNIELVLGGTFLSFFILALRKRFKQ